MALKNYQANEALRCGTDPIYFFNEYVKIQHPIRGSIPFKTYDFQDQVVRDFTHHRFNVVLKARQLGLSTITAAYAVWMILFRKNVNILVVATQLRTAKNFIRKCKYIIKNLPDWLKMSGIESETVQSIETKGGSILKAVPTSPDAGRSEALSLLIVDEAAFIRDFDELWKGVYSTLSTGGRAIIISTPSGAAGKFYDLYVGSVNKENEFNSIVLPWNVHPERDQEWFEKETKNMTRKEIAQELECDFIASGDTYLDNTVLDSIRQMVKEPMKREGIDRNIWIWKEPEENHKYIISADTARGDGKDYSAFHVIDGNEAEIVAEYKGKMPPDRFAEMINEVGLKYNKALVCPENNSVGYATIQKLCSLQYPRIYRNKEKSLNLWSSMLLKPGDLVKPSGDLGIFTSGFKRNTILTKMEEMLRNNLIKTNSLRLYQELQTFVWINNHKIGAQSGKNDDLVMSLAIGLWLLDCSDFYEHSEERGKALLDAMSQDSVKLDDIINDNVRTQNNEYSVFLPTASSSNFGERKKNHQKLSDKWKWVL